MVTSTKVRPGEIYLNPTLTRAVVVVTFALISYSLAIVSEQRKNCITKQVLTFLTVGVLLDISSTTLMIIGSRKIPITVHGFIGYSALTAMLIDTILMWRFWHKNGSVPVPKGLNIYTRLAYGWWIIAYIAGAIIAMTLKS
jgi:hypothetical protein